MLNLSVQILDNDMFEKLTKLKLQELFMGNVIYIITLLTWVVLIFRKKNI